MALAFLSHSSKQKPFVEKIAKELNSLSIIDSKSFEEGLLNSEEIENLINKCDVFVICLSDDSLNSPWVKDELEKAYYNLNNNLIERIYPVIIDKNITYKDPRIPQWLKDNYNLQLVLRSGKVLRLIKARLREAAWNKHPRLKMRDSLFVGRNKELAIIEERIDDIEKKQPTVLFATGIPKVGRKKFLKKSLIKTNIVFREATEHPTILLDYNESIEDFIVKIYDLGISEEITFPNFMTTSIEDKIDIAIKLIKDVQGAKEIIFIDDVGSIILPRGEIVGWFYSLLYKLKSHNIYGSVIFCISSKFRIKTGTLIGREDIFQTQITVLNKREIQGLLMRLGNLYNIDFVPIQLNQLSEILNGFPEQVFHAIEYVKSSSFENVLKNPNVIKDYNKETFNMLVQDVETNDTYKSVLSILVEFDFISYDVLLEILNSEEKSKIEEILNNLDYHSLIDFLGSNKEYFKLNEGIKNYLLRSGYKFNLQSKQNLKNHIENFIKNDNLVNQDISDFFFSIKGALLGDYKIKMSLILPSHYLKTMIYLYEREKKYEDVIMLADRVIENESKLDVGIVREIKYMLCLSLARLRNVRFKEEVQFFKNDSDYHFLFGFYYRLLGKMNHALNSLQDALVMRPRFSKAQRELVQVLIGLDNYSDAMEHAKFNFENDKTNNPFHIQAYYDCLIKSGQLIENKPVIDDLLSRLSSIQSDKAKEMLLIANADYEIYLNKNADRAIILINEALASSSRKSTSLLNRKFAIAEKARKLLLMEEVIGDFENNIKKYGSTINDKNNFNIMKAKLLAHQGQKTLAANLLKTNVQFFPEKSLKRLIEYVMYC